MSSINTISVEKLTRLVGTPHCPALIDVRTDDDFKANPGLIPSSMRRPHADPSDWAGEFTGRSAIIVCQNGAKLSQGVAAWLRHSGIPADGLEDGFEGWRKANLPLVPIEKMPKPDRQGRTVWVTRARPKVDRIACPWLIRRFVDPNAVILYVAPAEVTAVAERFAATPFDVEGVFWSDRGGHCTFDVMVEEFALATDPLNRLAAIVRGADTGRFEEAPQAAGLLAASLGLSRMYADDLAQLEAGMTLYDAFYRWCRDATEETHTWHSKKP
jgi:rhodanese-related sulfurtransferase